MAHAVVPISIYGYTRLPTCTLLATSISKSDKEFRTPIGIIYNLLHTSNQKNQLLGTTSTWKTIETEKWNIPYRRTTRSNLYSLNRVDDKKSILSSKYEGNIPYTFRHLHSTSIGGIYDPWAEQRRPTKAFLWLPHDLLHSQSLPALRPMKLICFRLTEHNYKFSKVQHISSKTEFCTDR